MIIFCFRLIKKIRNRIHGLLFGLCLKIKGAHLAGFPVVYGFSPKVLGCKNLYLGKKCCFGSFRVKICITVWADAQLRLGDNVFLNDGVNICASTNIQIGDNTKIGDMVNIFDTDFHQVSPDTPTRMIPISIGKNVWIGANAIILAGADIGDHSVIAAGSVVTGAIPPRCVAAGVPARVIKIFELASDDWVRK